MSSSCGELGLRIALCDLIERLKRCEQKCSYLEECRHELIKEVMRLRVQNEWLSNTCRHTVPVTDSQLLALNSSHNQLIIPAVNEPKEDKTIGYQLTTDTDSRDESWEQITVRLLQDLKRDVAHGLNGQVVDGQHSYGTQLITATTDDIIDTNLTNNETIITINDSLTQLDDNLMDSKTYITESRQKPKQMKTSLNSTANDSNLIPFHDFNKSLYLISKTDNKLKKIYNNRNEIGTKDQNSDEKRSANYCQLFDANAVDGNVESINAFCSAMSYIKRDMNEVFVALNSHNDILNRLKDKQLRNFFKRQINLDQNCYQTSATSPPLKTNHENY